MSSLADHEAHEETFSEDIPLEQVEAAFLAHTDRSGGTDLYALEALRLADRELGGKWRVVQLSRKELINIVLPPHRHGKPKNFTPLIPPPGLSLDDTLERLAVMPEYSRVNPQCWSSLITAAEDHSPIYLASQPVSIPS